MPAILHSMKNMPTQNNTLSQNTAGKPIPKDVADRFGITGFRTEKFKNDAEDSSKVDRCCDHPVMMEVLERIHNAAVSCQLK